MIHIVRPVTEQVKKLRIHDRHNKIERRIRITDDKEQRRFPVPDQVKLQLVICCDLPQFRK